MVYLISEDLSHLGGPMGTEYTTESEPSFFSSVEEAQSFAEAEYGEKIDWSQKKSPTSNLIPLDLTCSGDLGYIMYHIREVKIKKKGS